MTHFFSPLLLPSALAAGLVLGLLLIGRVPLRYIARNLIVRWKTTIMTALAFTLVVALLTVMLAFVNGMYKLTEASGHAENVIILSDGATDELFSKLGPADAADIENQPGVARSPSGRPLASREIYLVVNQPMIDKATGRPKRRFLQVRGIDEPATAILVHGMDLHARGAWFSSAGVQEAPPTADTPGTPGPIVTRKGETAIQAVIGEGIARELGQVRTEEQMAAARNPQRLDIGDTFSLCNRLWVVVGVMQSAGSTFDSEVWAKSGIIGPMFRKEGFTSIVLRAPDAAGAKRLKQYFTDHYKKTRVLAQVETDYFSSLGASSKQFLISIIIVTAVMAVGGVFGVMNTMYAAISQRTKDIGVLRLVGYSRWQILVAFLLESLLIALVGGSLGCALGSLADGLNATSVVSAGPAGGKLVVLTLTVSAEILAAGVLLSIVMGGLGGILPSIKAIRLRPLEALQ